MTARSLKSYFSYIEPAQHTEYTNEILSGGPRVRFIWVHKQ